VEERVGLNLVVEKMLQKVKREDVDQHVQRVKHIKGEKEKDDLGRSNKETLRLWTKSV